MSKVLFVICARGGSKRIPNKNLKMFNGKTLLEGAIEKALRSKFINRIVVSSDSDEIINVAKKYKIDIIKRAPELSGDKTELLIAVKDAVMKFPPEYDTIVIHQIDSVFTTTRLIDKCIETHKALGLFAEEVMTYHNNKRTGSVRVLPRKYLFWGVPSARTYLIQDYPWYVDAETPEKFEFAEKILENNKWIRYILSQN